MAKWPLCAEALRSLFFLSTSDYQTMKAPEDWRSPRRWRTGSVALRNGEAFGLRQSSGALAAEAPYRYDLSLMVQTKCPSFSRLVLRYFALCGLGLMRIGTC